MITGAAADIAFQFVPNGLAVQVWFAAYHVHSSHDHARRAEAALQAMIIAECLLHWVQLPVLGKTLDGYDLCPFGLHRKHAARFDRFTVDMNDACPALAGVAADMRPRETQLLAQEVDEQGTVFRFGRNRFSVHRHGHNGHMHSLECEL